MGNIGDLVATATLDIAPFMANTRNLKTYMKTLDNSLKAVENSFKGHGSRVKGLKAVYAETGSALKGYQELLKRQSQKYSELKESIGDVDKATAKQKKSLINAKSAMMETAAIVSELQSRLKALATETSVFTRFGNAAEQAGKKMRSFGDSVSGVGAAFTKGVTAPIAAGAGYAIKAAIEYEDAFAGVKKTVDEVKDSNGKVIYSYDMLSKGIRQMAKEIPASTTEISHVAEAAGQLGIKTKDILGFTRVMIDMGKSTNLSSEEAATALARFANITQLDPSRYSNLGSSIVELGNNFATTEKEIVEMGLRLAGTGKVVGLTDPQILGLATAMSSVGIEAEAGGSAFSRVMQKINTQVLSSGEDLWKFAKIAGKSADEFAASWKKNPQEAIIDFVKGLKRFKDEGKDVTAYLKDMDINSVREIDTLQRLAGAGDLLGDAFKSANKGFSENKALMNEANKRYETTASKLQMLKNQVNDVAIEFGGPLIDALRDGLEASRPFIKGVADLAKSFSSLDKEQQRQIIKWGLIAAASGPALSIFGKGVGVIGGTIQGLGRLSKTLGDLSGSMSAARTGTAALGASAGGATTAISGMSGAAALLGNPLTWGVILGGAAAVAVGYFAQKAYEAHQRTQEWGTKVSQVQANELQSFKDKVDQTNQSMEGFRGGAEQVNSVKTAFQGLVAEIEKLENKDLSEKIKLAEQFGFSQGTMDQIKKSSRQTVENVKQMSDEVINIYQNASNEHRRLTEEEKAVVLANQNELINVQLSKLNYSAKEKKAIVKAMNGDLNSLNSQQLTKALEVTEKWIKAENKSYNKLKSGLKKVYDSIKGNDKEAVKTREEIHKKQQLEADHYLKMEAYGKRYAAIQKKLLKGTAKYLDPQLQQAMVNDVKKQMKELGLSYEELMTKTTKAASKAQEVNTMWARTTKKSTEDQKLANSQWNGLVWNPKTGKLKTNAKEEVAKALEAEGGWDRLKFIAKNANLETNARITMAEVLVETGKWDTLTPEEKELVVDGHQGIQAIVESKQHLEIWNSLPEEVKRILGDNKDFLNKKGVATRTLENWNALKPDEKKLLAKNLTKKGKDEAQKTINSLVGKEVKVTAANKTLSGVNSAQRTLNSVQDKHVTIWASIKKTASDLWSKLTGYAVGTDYHPGGLAMVNDQKGSLYKELVTLPNGQSFIPDGRDVILPLPRGSKVMKASATRDYMYDLGIPKYANGIGFDNTKIANITQRMSELPKNTVTSTTDDKLYWMIEEMIAVLKSTKDNSVIEQALDIAEQAIERPVELYLQDGQWVAKVADRITNYQTQRNSRNNRMKGMLN
ncbi:phage tail protein [Streptococcus agalactiae]|uniref:phage tail tape measure protein n=1 Tax=Streptococcus agalactiae TaxID=1311 RepID=UPI0006591809|nr:phage tail tape measure protein [Streptococcus agalactiae]KLJ60532.1 phage tail protein [Streptococcus agalactiae]KLJ60631.1 phage tail protein [Streptococcus agalactiae]